MRHLADVVSLSRMMLAYPLHRCLYLGESLSVSVLLLWMIASDALDGWFARRYGPSAWGAWLDPLADAVAMMSWVLTMHAMGRIEWPWLLFWLLRYAFFSFWALWLRVKFRYCLPAAYGNKISIVIWVIYLAQLWVVGHVSALWQALLLAFQCVSMLEIMIKSLAIIRGKMPVHGV